MKTKHLITHVLPGRQVRFEVWSCYGNHCNGIRRGVFATREQAVRWKNEVIEIDIARNSEFKDANYWVQIESPTDDLIEVSGKGPESTTDMPVSFRIHSVVVSL